MPESGVIGKRKLTLLALPVTDSRDNYILVSSSISSPQVCALLKHEHDIIILFVPQSSMELRKAGQKPPFRADDVETPREVAYYFTSDFDATVVGGGE